MSSKKYEARMTEYFKTHRFISTAKNKHDQVIDVEKLAISLLSEGSYPWNDTVGEMMDEIAGDPGQFELRIEEIK